MWDISKINRQDVKQTCAPSMGYLLGQQPRQFFLTSCPGVLVAFLPEMKQSPPLNKVWETSSIDWKWFNCRTLWTEPGSG